MVSNERTARQLARLPVPERNAVLGDAAKNGETVTSASVRRRLPVPTKEPGEAAKPEADKTGVAIPKKVLSLWHEAEGVETLLSAISSVRVAVRNAQEETVGGAPHHKKWRHDLDPRYLRCPLPRLWARRLVHRQ